jgi:hypothetical protein
MFCRQLPHCPDSKICQNHAVQSHMIFQPRHGHSNRHCNDLHSSLSRQSKPTSKHIWNTQQVLNTQELYVYIYIILLYHIIILYYYVILLYYIISYHIIYTYIRNIIYTYNYLSCIYIIHTYTYIQIQTFQIFPDLQYRRPVASSAQECRPAYGGAWRHNA